MAETGDRLPEASVGGIIYGLSAGDLVPYKAYVGSAGPSMAELWKLVGPALMAAATRVEDERPEPPRHRADVASILHRTAVDTATLNMSTQAAEVGNMEEVRRLAKILLEPRGETHHSAANNGKKPDIWQEWFDECCNADGAFHCKQFMEPLIILWNYEGETPGEFYRRVYAAEQGAIDAALRLFLRESRRLDVAIVRRSRLHCRSAFD